MGWLIRISLKVCHLSLCFSLMMLVMLFFHNFILGSFRILSEMHDYIIFIIFVINNLILKCFLLSE